MIVRPDGTEVATLFSGGAFAPIWSPDGTRLVIQQGIGTDNLSVVDLAGQAQQITDESGTYSWVGWGRLPSPVQPTPGMQSTSPSSGATSGTRGIRAITGRVGYIRKTPNFVSAIGALSDAEMASASTSRVWAGSMTPSSHSRAVE